MAFWIVAEIDSLFILVFGIHRSGPDFEVSPLLSYSFYLNSPC